jgi:hypothetical protein
MLMFFHLVTPPPCPPSLGHFVIFNENAGRFATAETEPIISQTDFQGIAQGSETEDLKFRALKQAHLHKPLHERVFALDCGNSTALARP